MKYLNIFIIFAIIAGAIFFIFRSLRPEAVVEAVSYGPAVDAVPGVVTVIEKSIVTIKSEVTGRLLKSNLFLGAKVQGLDQDEQTIEGDEAAPSTEVSSSTQGALIDPLGLDALIEQKALALTKLDHNEATLDEYLALLDKKYINFTHDLNENIDYDQFIEDGDGADLIAVVDSTDLELELEAFEIGFKGFKENLAIQFSYLDKIERAKTDLKNDARKFREGSIPGLDWKRALNSYRLLAEGEKRRFIGEAQDLATRRNDKKRRLRQLSKTKIYAPVTGTITEIFVWPGEQVNHGTPIATIISDALLVQADINEENIAGLRVGQKASVRFLSYGNRIFEGTVSRMLPSADPETQQYSVYLDLDEGNDLLQQGLTGEVSIIKDKKESVLRIPRRALLGDFVFVVENNIATLRKVEVGYRDLINAEIVSGLEEGELVITEKLDLFKDGDKVRLSDSE